MKDECRERIAKLEALLERSSEEKDEMRSTILSLSSQVSELRVKVEYLEMENKELHKSVRKKKPTHLLRQTKGLKRLPNTTIREYRHWLRLG